MSRLSDHFQMLARYNMLANVRLYDYCARLDDAERKKIRQAFFKSIHGTLNHILVADRLWLARFEGGQSPATSLDTVLYDDFEALRTARTAEDARIERLAAGLTDELVDGSITYINSEGRNLTNPAELLIAHFFNHQTHHRGQIHDMLSQTGIETPVLDMQRILRP
jgi:uncharacterized damage-inducible protein DinB